VTIDGSSAVSRSLVDGAGFITTEAALAANILRQFNTSFTRVSLAPDTVERPVEAQQVCCYLMPRSIPNLRGRVKTVKALRCAVRLVSFVLVWFVLLCSGSVFAAPSCNLDPAHGKIKHVIFVVFDNTHFRRDNPNVPSDLEQMPHLLNFLRQNGTFEGNHHAVLISHTADDILTALTGVYGDRHGIPVANSYGVYRPDGSVAVASSFFYWTDLVSDP
jgi:hypothetical protein